MPSYVFLGDVDLLQFSPLTNRNDPVVLECDGVGARLASAVAVVSPATYLNLEVTMLAYQYVFKTSVPLNVEVNSIFKVNV